MNKKEIRKQKKKLKKQHPLYKQRLVAKILLVIVSIGLITVSAFSVYAFSIIKDAPDIYADDFIQPDSTKIYDKDHNEIYDTGLKIRENVSYEELPQSLIDAFIAVEDSRFFVHSGFDVPRFTKAALSNLSRSLKSGSLNFGQGGSTFTMQLIKNTYFMYENPETGEVQLPASGARGIERKIQEIYLSQKLDKQNLLSKKVILELYLNMINFGAGNNIVGIQNSSEAYFGKDVSELSLVESAFLAGVINAPSINTPYYSLKNAKNRTQEVLDLMLLHGYIDKDEHTLASSVNIENLFIDPNDSASGENLPYQAYIDVVISEVKELTGLNPITTPMKIYTAMDQNVQSGIDKFQRREIASLDHGKDTHIQVGSAIVQNKTGEIVGVVGGYDYNGRLLYNRAKDSSFQPASTIKPIVDYALAFEYLGWSTSHVLVDEPYVYAGTDRLVGNYDGRYWGEVTLMDAVADSRNIPAIKTLQAAIDTIGRDGVINYLQKLGFSKSTDENFDIQFAIGGSAFETSPIELAGAYSVVMNGGNYIQPHTVTKIEFLDGRDPLIPQYSSVPVLSDSAAYLVSRTMKYAVEGPYPGYLSSLRRSYPVFGKTGTNRYDSATAPSFVPSNGMKARLMIAATSDFSIATWTGFDIVEEKHKPWFSPQEASFNLPGKLNSYLLDLVESSYGPGKDLDQPSGVVSFKHIIGTYPYQKPMEDMNPKLITTGLIKKEFLKLQNPSPQELKSLSESGQKVDYDVSGNKVNFNIELEEYPDKDRLKVAPGTLTMKFPGSDKTTSGTKLYDDSWIFGAVRYKTEIRRGNEIVKELKTDQVKHTLSISRDDLTADLQVCSYYTYELTDARKSNSVCQPFNAQDILKDIPVQGPVDRFLDSLNQWLNGHGIPEDNVNINWLPSDNIALFKSIKSITPDVYKENISTSELKTTQFQIETYDYQFSKGQNINEIPLNKLKDYMNSIEVKNEASESQLIKSIKVNNSEISHFSLHQYQEKSLIITLE